MKSGRVDLQAGEMLGKPLTGEQVIQIGEFDRIADDHVIAAVALGDIITTAANQPVFRGITDQARQRIGRGDRVRHDCR